MANYFRSEAVDQAYKEVREKRQGSAKCALCDARSIREYTHWRIINNDYPYDLIADVHHMIVPRRHLMESGLNYEEWQEFQKIKHSDIQEYEFMIEGTHKSKSIPEHFHVHLIKAKPVKGAAETVLR